MCFSIFWEKNGEVSNCEHRHIDEWWTSADAGCRLP